MNFSGVRLDMSFKEATELDAMLKRNKARPSIKGKGMHKGEEFVYYTCPVCGMYLFDEDNFCRDCGQRIDKENTEL